MRKSRHQHMCCKEWCFPGVWPTRFLRCSPNGTSFLHQPASQTLGIIFRVSSGRLYPLSALSVGLFLRRPQSLFRRLRLVGLPWSRVRVHCDRLMARTRLPAGWAPKPEATEVHYADHGDVVPAELAKNFEVVQLQDCIARIQDTDMSISRRSECVWSFRQSSKALNAASTSKAPAW